MNTRYAAIGMIAASAEMKINMLKKQVREKIINDYGSTLQDMKSVK